MSSDNNGSSSKKLLLVAAGGAVLAGAAYFLFARAGAAEKDEQVSFSKKPSRQATEATVASSETRTASSANQADDERTMSSMGPQATTMMANEYDFADASAATEGSKPKEAPHPAAAHAAVRDEEGVTRFDVGVSIKLSDGWKASEEPSPMPNVAMITFNRDEYASRNVQGMPGEVPVVLMSIEDISNEGITIDEFREKSKMMALQQMAAMTQGTAMPSVSTDEKLSTPAGPFTHALIYEQRTPYFVIQVLNLTCVQGNLAYIFQVMAAPQEFQSVKKAVMDMARTAKITLRDVPEDFRELSCTDVACKWGSVSMPAAWTVETSSANPVFKLRSASHANPEIVQVFDNTAAGAFDDAKWKKYAEPKTINGATVAFLSDGSNKCIVATTGSATAVCKPVSGSSCVSTPNLIAYIAVSADFAKKADATTLKYVNRAMKFGFVAREGSRIIESRLSDKTMVYAPAGLPKDPMQPDENPMMTVRVGDPSNDPDCRATLDEWLNRIREETDSESISELKKTTLCDRECVTFTNKEMQEVGPGQAEERTAKVVIFLKGTRTTMIRWEAPTGAFRKHEGKLNALLQSLELY